jgi:hypothetical protein
VIFVTYSASGAITGCHEGDPSAVSEPTLKVDEFRADWGSTHRVVSGKLKPIPRTQIEARDRGHALQDLRSTRDRLLRETVDTMNPIRWESMSEAERETWRAYRQALCDLPRNCADPLAPVWPTAPN